MTEPVTARESPASDVCKICEEEIAEDSEVIVEPCGHKFCRNCCEQYVRTKLSDQYTEHEVQCPESGCQSLVNISKIPSLIQDQKLRDQMARRSLDSWLHMQTDTRKCPTPDCTYAVLAPPTSAEQPSIKCPLCGASFCYACGSKAHEGHECPGGTIKSETQISGLRTGKVIRCPVCKAKIEKVEGCDAMQCSLCKAFLCWGCGQNFPTSNAAHHHNCRGDLHKLRLGTAREPDSDSEPESTFRREIDQEFSSRNETRSRYDNEDEGSISDKPVRKPPRRKKQAREKNTNWVEVPQVSTAGNQKKLDPSVAELNWGMPPEPPKDDLQRSKCRKCSLVLFFAAGIIAVPILVVLSIFILPVLLAQHLTKKLTKNKFYCLKVFGLWFATGLLLPLAAPANLVYGVYWSSVLWYAKLKDLLFNTHDDVL